MKKTLLTALLFSVAICGTVLAQDNGNKQKDKDKNEQKNTNKEKDNTNSKTQKQHQKMPAGSTHGK